MKIFLKEIYQLDTEYQEILIDEDSFKNVQYVPVSTQKQYINGLLYEDIYVLEPLTYYKIKIKEHISYHGSVFIPNYRLLESGMIVSFCKQELTVFVYNTTQNHIFLKKDVMIGEVE